MDQKLGQSLHHQLRIQARSFRQAARQAPEIVITRNRRIHLNGWDVYALQCFSRSPFWAVPEPSNCHASTIRTICHRVAMSEETELFSRETDLIMILNVCLGQTWNINIIVALLSAQESIASLPLSRFPPQMSSSHGTETWNSSISSPERRPACRGWPKDKSGKEVARVWRHAALVSGLCWVIIEEVSQTGLRRSGSLEERHGKE